MGGYIRSTKPIKIIAYLAIGFLLIGFSVIPFKTLASQQEIASHRLLLSVSNVQSTPIQSKPRIMLSVSEAKPAVTSNILPNAGIKFSDGILALIFTSAIALVLISTLQNIKKKKEEEIISLSFKTRTNLEGIIGFSDLTLRLLRQQLLHTRNNNMGPPTSEQKELLEDIDYLQNILLGSKTILHDLNEIENINKPLDEATLHKMSFKWRTALNQIIGFASLISQKKLTENQKEYINNVLYEAKDILRLVPNQTALIRV